MRVTESSPPPTPMRSPRWPWSSWLPRSSRPSPPASGPSPVVMLFNCSRSGARAGLSRGGGGLLVGQGQGQLALGLAVRGPAAFIDAQLAVFQLGHSGGDAIEQEAIV